MSSRQDHHQSWSGILMGSTRTPMLLMLWSTVLLAVLSTSSAQESNFGVKVKCYLQDGTVVCPGCNSRAGLLCPRTNNMESCNVKTEPPIAQPPPITHIYEDEEKSTTIKEPQGLDTKNATIEVFPFGGISQEEVEYWSKKARENLQFRLFLYRILQPAGYKPIGGVRRWRREAQVVEDDDTCGWNGDCPCPLICCNAGDGCPKRCVKGIRLPPPWG